MCLLGLLGFARGEEIKRRVWGLRVLVREGLGFLKGGCGDLVDLVMWMKM